MHASALTESPAGPALPQLRITVDTVILTVLAEHLQVLLVRRGETRFLGQWSLPGGFIREDESLEHAALRELRQATGVHDVYLEQLYTFGDPARDTRGRVVSVAYVALLAADRCPLTPHRLEDEARWWPVDQLPQVAFDHGPMIAHALARIRTKLEYTSIGSQLVGEHFSLSELQSIYEIILGRRLDKRNFRRKLQLLGLVESTDQLRQDRLGRPAKLYRFCDSNFFHLRDRGNRAPF